MAEEKKSGIKYFYAVEANIGISMRKDITWENPGKFYYFINDEAKLSYRTSVYGCNFMGGIELNSYFKAGIGTGYSYYKQNDHGFGLPYTTSHISFPSFITHESTITHRIPLYLYLRSDFLDRNISPFMDLKIGNNFLITKEIIRMSYSEYYWMEEDFGFFKLKNGLFVAANIGVALKESHRNAVNISIGYQSVSRSYDISLSSGYFEYAPTGYTIIDHQFLLNVGISF
jgi:outer membrane protein assembly factor BamA